MLNALSASTPAPLLEAADVPALPNAKGRRCIAAAVVLLALLGAVVAVAIVALTVPILTPVGAPVSAGFVTEIAALV